MFVILVSACGGGDAPPVPPPPSGTDTPNVCAHWQHDAQRAISGGNGVGPYGAEIGKAKAMGVDCFALNIISWNSVQKAEINNLWTAAENWNASHPNDKFFLFPRLDICCGMSEATIDAIHADHYNSPARLRVDGGRYGDNRPVTGTWHGETTEWTSGDSPQATWTRIQNEWNADGKPAFFMPYFWHQGSDTAALFDRWDGADPNSQSDDVVDALSQWDGFAQGDNSISASQVNHEFDVQADARPGMDMMAGCSPVFNRHSGTEQFGNRILSDFEGFHAWKTCHEGVVQDQPRFLEYITWNDYLEGTTLGGPYPGQLPSSWANNDLDHAAYRKLAEYYIGWYKTGARPTITNDTIAIAHRLSSKNAVASGDPLPKPEGWEQVEDVLYAAVILKEPAQIRLHSDNTSQTFDVASGVHEVSMPFAEGSQRIVLLRNGQTRLVATSSKPIDNDITIYNFNYNTAWAEN